MKIHLVSLLSMLVSLCAVTGTSANSGEKQPHKRLVLFGAGRGSDSNLLSELREVLRRAGYSIRSDSILSGWACEESAGT